MPVFIAVLGAIALVAGIWRMHLGWWLTGGVLLFVAVLWAALASEPEAIGDGQPQALEVLTLRVRPTDSATGKPLADAEVAIVRHRRSLEGSQDHAAPEDAISNVSVSSLSSDGVTIVSALIESTPGGTVWSQLHRPRADVGDYELVVEAPGYQTWRIVLDEILPDGWTIEAASSETIEARLVVAADEIMRYNRTEPALSAAARSCFSSACHHGRELLCAQKEAVWVPWKL